MKRIKEHVWNIENKMSKISQNVTVLSGPLNRQMREILTLDMALSPHT